MRSRSKPWVFFNSERDLCVLNPKKNPKDLGAYKIFISSGRVIGLRFNWELLIIKRRTLTWTASFADAGYWIFQKWWIFVLFSFCFMCLVDWVLLNWEMLKMGGKKSRLVEGFICLLLYSDNVSLLCNVSLVNSYKSFFDIVLYFIDYKSPLCF